MIRPRILEAMLAAAGIALMAGGIASHARALRAKDIGQRPPAAQESGAAAQRTFAVVGARVFDGTAVLDRATVLVENGVIKSVGTNVPVPDGTAIVDGTNSTLLPGLIDAHTHAFGDALARALVFGVTTELDMFTDQKFAASMRAEQASGVVSTRADLFSAGTLATAPGGHGTEFGGSIPTLTRADQAQAFVDARLAEGSDYIKIIYDDGAALGYAFPSLDRPTVAALIAAAHRRGKMAIVHVATQQAAREVLEDGADGLAHVFADVPADAAFVRLARARGAFVIPTLAVIASTSGHAAEGAKLAADPAFAAFVEAGDRRSLGATFPARPGARQSLDAARESVARLRVAGVTLLAGTDAPNPGTAHGISLHRELELLVGAGLSPLEALAAATSVPARVFHLADRGRLAPGLRADLLLVDGDPTRDITATRHIVSIWKGGIAVERRPAAPEAARPAPVVTGGVLSEFEGDMRVGFGSGWVVSTDKLMGGSSEATMRIVEGGAGGSRGSLEIAGTIRPGSMYPWAGAMVFPGPQPMAPANLSRFKELVFWARGDGGTFHVLLFAAHFGGIPADRPFTAGAEWREQVMPFSSFGDVDGSDVAGLLFGAGAGQSAFRLQIDDVHFR